MKYFMHTDELGWNWDKRWNIPNLQIILTVYNNNKCYLLKLIFRELDWLLPIRLFKGWNFQSVKARISAFKLKYDASGTFKASHIDLKGEIVHEIYV